MSSNVLQNKIRCNKTDTIKTNSLILSDAAMLAYIALCMECISNTERYYVSINSLCFNLFDNNFSKITRRTKDKIKPGLQELAQNHVVDLVEVCKSEYIATIIGIDTNAEYYTCVTDAEIRKVMAYNNPSLLRYFCVLISSLDHLNDNVGYWSEEKLADCARISRKTASAYNDILTKEEVIYIHVHIPFVKKDGTFGNLNNNYGRYKDKDTIDEYAAKYAKEHGYLSAEGKLAIKVANDKRRLKQQYNRLVAFVENRTDDNDKPIGKRYSADIAKQLFDYAVENKLSTAPFDIYLRDDQSGYIWDEIKQQDKSYEDWKNNVLETGSVSKVEYTDRQQDNISPKNEHSIWQQDNDSVTESDDSNFDWLDDDSDSWIDFL